MKKEASEGKLGPGQGQGLDSRKVMTYRNTNKRVTKLIRLGLIEDRKPDASTYTVNVHGRKDYKVTMKGQHTLVNGPLL